MSHKHKIVNFRSLDGLTLVAEVAGDPASQPVILMHGGGQTRHSWGRALCDLAARGYYVVNLDARGHGDSEWARSPSHYDLDYLAADLKLAIESLANPPALVGASMGGLTALHALGANAVPAVSALVLVDIVPHADAAGIERIMEFMNANPHGFSSVEEAAAAVATYNPHRPRPKDAGGLMKNLRRRPDGRLRWHWDPQVIAVSEGRQQHRPEELIERARRYSGPALLVRGMRSDIVNESGIEKLRTAMPQLEVADVAAAGHMIAGDRNDLFNRALVHFLQRHLPAVPA